MRRAERLFRLVNEMRTRGVSRAADLAEHFEVSVSTVYRDVAHLQASGLPIEGEAGVGYLLRPGFDLPNVTFTNDQVDALAIGLSFVERTGDPALASAAREARAKIQASMPSPEERRLADAPFFNIQNKSSATPGAGLIREAIRTRRIVRIVYGDGEGRRTERQVLPLVIWNLNDGWMFSGWCQLRQDFRTFRWDRTAELAMTSEAFEEGEATKLLNAFMELETCESRDH